VRTTDPAASLDLPAWCHLTGHTYLGPIRAGTAEAATTPPTYALKLTNRAVATDPDQPWLPTPPRH
jgi:tRNA 2-thiouridine synthesizing protein A